eukprot:s3116_g6.t1
MAPKTGALMTSPVKVKGLWDFTKQELLNEAQARGLWLNPKWTVPEIRSIVQEDMNRSTPNPLDAKAQLPTGLSKMTVAEMQATAEELGVEATKGTIMRLIRDNVGGGSQLVMSFGRYKGYLYSETPMGYRKWAMAEVASNPNRSEDLQMYANWCQMNAEVTTTPARYVEADDPELNAMERRELESAFDCEGQGEGTRHDETTTSELYYQRTGISGNGGRGVNEARPPNYDPRRFQDIRTTSTRSTMDVIPEGASLNEPTKEDCGAKIDDYESDSCGNAPEDFLPKVQEKDASDYDVKAGGYENRLRGDMGEECPDVSENNAEYQDRVYKAEPSREPSTSNPHAPGRRTNFHEYQISPKNGLDTQENQADFSNYQVPIVGDVLPQKNGLDIRENQADFSNYQVPIVGDVLSQKNDLDTRENQADYQVPIVGEMLDHVTICSGHGEMDRRAPRYDLGGPIAESLEACHSAFSEGRGGRPLFIEIHNRNNQLTRCMEANGFEALSIDLSEWDLSIQQNRVDLVQLVLDLEPDVVWCTPEYHLWKPSQDHRITHEQQARDLDEGRCRHHREHLSVMNEIYKLQAQGGRVAVVEHPNTFVAWSTRALNELDVYMVITDMCAYGAILPDHGGNPGAIKGPTRLKTTHEKIRDFLSRRCDGPHPHLDLRGHLPDGTPRSHAARDLQVGFCDRAAKALIETLNGLADAATPTTRPTTMSHVHTDGEKLAAQKLREKAFHVNDLQELAETLRLSCRKRHRKIYGGKEVKVEGVMGGLWTHGGMTGISSVSGELPNFVTYVNAFMRHRLENVATDVHCDHHNLPNSMSYTITFGEFSGWWPVGT